MRALDPSVGLASELDPVSRVVLEFEEAWRSGGPPPLDRFRDRLGPDEAPCGLAELVKADLQNRYRLGERPAAREYLDRFPELAEEGGRALSLIYEEYCLRAEAEGALDASEFCRAYPTWRDSLASQLAYHRDLSRAVEPADEGPEFPIAGDRFAEYELVKILGMGGSARVYLAHATNLGGRPHALKVGPNRGAEPSILGKLDHPNIVPVQAMVVDPATGLRGLCMPYRPGLALDELIRRLRREGLPRRARALRATVHPDDEAHPPGWADFPDAGAYADAVAWVGLKVARALAHAHSRGFLHRDVKPENVLLNGRDGPQLIDFNLAHDPDSADRARAAQRGGTLPYMAREQLEAFLDPAKWGHLDGRADLFSLGLVLREMLTLESPSRPSDHLDLPRAVNAMIRAREAPREPIRRTNPAVPHALEAIVAKCLTPSADDRYTGAADLASDLALYLARRPLLYAKNPSHIESALNGLRRHRVGLAVAAVALAIAVCLVLIARPRGGRDLAPTSTSLQVLDLAAADEAAGRQPEASTKIARVLDHGDAIRSFEAALRKHPQSLALLIGLATAYEKGDYLDDAERAYREVLARDPSRIGALAGLANIRNRRGRHAEAADLFGQCIARAELSRTPQVRAEVPRYRLSRAQQRIALGDLAYDAQRLDAALGHFRDALDDLATIGPDREGKGGGAEPRIVFDFEFVSAGALLGLGQTELKSGHADRAAKILREALDHATRARECRKRFGEELDPRLETAIRDALHKADPTH